MGRKPAARPRPRERERGLLRLASDLASLGRAGRSPRETLADALGRVSTTLAGPGPRRAELTRHNAWLWPGPASRSGWL
jgi:hypothetical protein